MPENLILDTSVLVIVFIVVHVIMMAISPEWSMSHPGIFLGVAIAGATTKFALEYFGANSEV